MNGRTVWANGARTLPASLYLASKPAFFGSRGLAMGGSADRHRGTLPAKARYDAHTPNVVP